MMETKIEKILNKIIIGCIFLVFLVPLLIVTQWFLPFIFPKAMVFRVLAEIMLVCYLPLLFSNFKKYKPPLSGLVVITSIFLLVMVAATIFSVDAYTSFFGTLERMEGLLSFLHFWFFFILLTIFLKDKKDWFNIFNFSVAISLLMDIYSILQRFGWSALVGSSYEDRFRSVGTIGNPAFLAAYLLLNCILILILLTKTKQKWLSLVYWLIFLFNLVIIYLTNTRGTILAVAVAFFLFVVFYIISFPRSRINKYIIITFLLFVFAASFIYMNRDKPWVTTNDSLMRLTNITLADESIQARIMAWKIGWQAFKEKPLLGWGPENYNIPFNKHFKSEFLMSFNYTVWYDRAHNVVVEMATTMGSLGLASYLAIFVYIFIKLFQRWRRNRGSQDRLLAVILVVGLIAYFIHNIFIFDTINSYILIFLIFAYINYFLIEEKGNLGEKIESVVENITAKKIKIWWLPIIILVLAIPFIRTIIHPVLANKAGFMGKVYFENNQPDKAMEYYRESFRYDTFIDAEILSHAADGVSDTLDKEEVPVEKKISYLEAIIAQGKKPLDRYPLNVKWYINLSKNYARLATYKDKEFNLAMAIDYLEKAIPLSPKRQRTYNELAFAYMRLGNSNKAIGILEDIIKDNPNIPEFYWNLFLVYEEIGNKEKALVALDKAVELRYPFAVNIDTNPHAIAFYESMGEYVKTLPFYRRLIRLDPKNVKWYMRIAIINAKLGNLAEAELWAYRIVEINPVYQEEVKAFVASLKK